MPTQTQLTVLSRYKPTPPASQTQPSVHKLFQSNQVGSHNTATGFQALLFSTADNNAAYGYQALLNNTSGTQNTANGVDALVFNTIGNDNTATGFTALSSNTAGNSNTADGHNALFSNTDGDNNTAIAQSALGSNTTGNNNTAVGYHALFFIQTGNNNTAVGYQALNNSISGSANTAIGDFALVGNSGFNNTAIGSGALLNNTTGFSNIALGREAGGGVSTADHVICIGALGANVNFGCFIGNIYSNVQPIVGTDPDSVTVTSSGRLGRGNVSSRRYKHDIKPMENASEVLYALKPAGFRYNKEYDATQTLAFGLIAEEVAEVAPNLVGRNPKGEPESVRYEQINALLLNEFLEEHKAFLEEQNKVQKLEAALEAVNARLKEQGAKIERVSAQVEVRKPAARTASINP
jgi:hypothetical protein